MTTTVERWDVLALELPAAEAVFTKGDRHFTARGPEVRFMPDEEGVWTYAAGGVSGTFVCTPAGEGNHGPVRADGLGFRYADGTPYRPYGTTAGHADAGTLAALAAAPFNRVRIGAPDEQRIRALRDLGIEAEVRLEGDGIAETVSRLAAYRNVWWCAPDDPEVLAEIREHDHGHHLLTVHGGIDTDFGAPWITHASLRHDQVRAIAGLTDALDKPVVVDACGAEGDAPDPEGSLPAQEMLARIWEGICQGGHVTHAESYGSRPWLAGECVERIAFLRRVLDDAPAGLRHNPAHYDASTIEAPGEYVLQYLGPHRYPRRRFELPDGTYRVDVIDTWNMTVRTQEPAPGGSVEVELPAEQYTAIRIRRA
ncbi:DUF5605 domain-containing protein [Streptomyces sp. NPDC007861]|uniref:DUF5605 domain-containing protein n=1 Tax=Streptomyces sp. NPDC007861 TaxID=3154893 RepID=UPI0033D0228C